jgi:phosphatidylserine/phosphatidylglycerophosphate/cardiolipin synthase-like enzyme
MTVSRATAQTSAPTGEPIITLEGVTAYFQSRRAGLDAQLVGRLVAFLDAASESLDCAIYDLRHPLVLAALQRAVARKVRLRIAYDASKERAGGMSADPKASGTQAALAAAGLSAYATPVHEHGRHLMHDKFVLRDRRDVWVGSANFTVGGLELQDNTCLTISSSDLVGRFAATFAELAQPHHQHEQQKSQTLLAASENGVSVGSTAITPLFAPAAGEAIEQQLAGALTEAIQGRKRIRLLAFLLSDPGLLQALAPLALQPDFDIRGVYDPNGMQDVLRYTKLDRSLFWFLQDQRFAAAPSHAFSAKREQDFMHNKTLIVGDDLIYTGSYNFSENAEANDEVSLKIVSAPLAAAYTDYSDTLFAAYEQNARLQPKSARAARDKTHDKTHLESVHTSRALWWLNLCVIILSLLTVAVAMAAIVMFVSAGGVMR